MKRRSVSVIVGLLAAIIVAGLTFPAVTRANSMGTAICLFVPTCMPPSIILTATANPIADGQSTVLSWIVAGANTNQITLGSVLGAGGGSTVIQQTQIAAIGSQTITPPDTTTYTVTATGPGGVSHTSITIGVQPMVTLTATPTTIQNGASSTLHWTSKHASSMSIATDAGPSPGTVTPVSDGTISVSPTVKTTYTVTATGPTGLLQTATATVTQSHTSIRWTVIPPTLGTATPDPTTSSGVKFVASSAAKDGDKGKLQATVTYYLASPLPPVTATAFADITIGSGINPVCDLSGSCVSPGIHGDVYSGGSVGNLSVDPKSVVSAAGAISGVTGTTFQIPGYTTSNSLDWTTAKTSILAQATKLRKERVNVDHVLSTQDFTISNGFNLNPVASGSLAYTNTQSVNAATPEGQVWWVPRDLTIHAATFYGRGTIIVGGKVTIRGNTSYSADAKTAGSLGIILTGNGDVTVDPAVKNIVGAYFVPNGAISFVGSGLSDGTPSGNPFLLQWGGNGTGNGQFGNGGPYGVATDVAGNVYVVDRANARVEKFSNSGSYIMSFPTIGAFYPYPAVTYGSGIALDSSGNIFVSDEANNRIQKFDSSGKYLTSWDPGNNPTNGNAFSPEGLAVDSAGNVYSAGFNYHGVKKFTNNGTPITQWGSYGNGNGQFSNPYGIALDTVGNVYVADKGNSRVQKFTSSGTYLLQWGSRGSGDGQFGGDWAIAIDRSNDVYVSDVGNGNIRIQKFDTSGNYLSKWGSPGTGTGSGNGSFSAVVYGLAADAAGNVFVSDTGEWLIQKFSPSTNGGSSTASTISATGLFVGNQIQLGRPIGSIRYDPRIGTLTPPGFGVVTNPEIKETAP